MGRIKIPRKIRRLDEGQDGNMIWRRIMKVQRGALKIDSVEVEEDKEAL